MTNDDQTEVFEDPDAVCPAFSVMIAQNGMIRASFGYQLTGSQFYCDEKAARAIGDYFIQAADRLEELKAEYERRMEEVAQGVENAQQAVEDTGGEIIDIRDAMGGGESVGDDELVGPDSSVNGEPAAIVQERQSDDYTEADAESEGFDSLVSSEGADDDAN